MGFRNSSRRSSPGIMGFSLRTEHSSVVIHDFDVFRTGRRPTKTQTPLVVDADAVLTRTVALQRLEAIAWRNPQVVQSCRDFELHELATSDSGDTGKATYAIAVCKRFRVRTLERPDHGV